MSLSSQQKRNRIKYSQTENAVGWQIIIWPFLNAKKADKSSLVVSPGKAEQDLFLKDFYEDLYISYGFLAASVAKKNPPILQELRVQSLGQEDSLEKEMQPTPLFLPRKFHGHKGLVGYSPWGHRVRHD